MNTDVVKKCSLIFVVIFTFLIPNTAFASPKAGAPCSKFGITASYSGKKYTCIKSGKKLVWNKGTIILQPKQTAGAPLDSSIVFGSISLSDTAFDPGESIVITAALSSPAGIKETSAILGNDSFPLVSVSVGRLLSGTTAEGIWEITLKIASSIKPQIYFVQVSAKNINGVSFVGKKIEVDIGGKVVAPINNSPRNSEGLLITCGVGFKSCPALTPHPPSTAECKIERPTPNWENPMTIGFTRPKWIKAPFKTAEVLIIPFSFTDFKVADDFLTSVKAEIKVEDEWITTNSYGKFKINWTIADRDSWFDFAGSYVDYKSQLSTDVGRRAFVQDLLRNYQKIDLTKYKSILIFGPYSNTIFGGMEFGGSYFSTPQGNVQGVSFTYGRSSLNLDHNIGHTIFAFEDLYLISALHSGATNYSDPEKWDIMGGGSNFVGWHRWINSWLDDSQVSCVGTEVKDSVFYLTALDKNDGGTKLISGITGQIATMAEYRYDPARSRGGVIVYSLDPSIEYGSGPMRSDDTMLQAGQKLTRNGITYEVLEADAGGVYVKVSKA